MSNNFSMVLYAYQLFYAFKSMAPTWHLQLSNSVLGTTIFSECSDKMQMTMWKILHPKTNSNMIS